MTVLAEDDVAPPRRRAKGPLIYRQSIWTRLTHWTWVVCLFFLFFTGLNIFNARPQLYIGQESGFEYSNTIFQIGQVRQDDSWRGFTEIFGHRFDTHGVLGVSGSEARPEYRAFPSWLTIPSFYDLGTARVVHFFFGWVFVTTMLIWFIASAINGHLRRDLVPRTTDVTGLPQDILDHATFRFHHTRSYSPLQKLAYLAVFVVLFPLVIGTGLTMSPGMDAAWPWLLDLFGGRQTARTIHFITMLLLVLFFVVHVLMVVLAGPINELRSMITGWYRASPGQAIVLSRKEERRNEV
jgi:thiosulfate reductase cytochrome b subunit